MLENKGNLLPRPDAETIETIKRIEKYRTLAEKLEQIGFEVQCSMDWMIPKELRQNELKQYCGNLSYYMNYIRNLVMECLSFPEELSDNEEAFIIDDIEEIGFTYIKNENGYKMIVWELLKENNYRKSSSKNCIDCRYFQYKNNEKICSDDIYYICNCTINDIKPLLEIENIKNYSCDQFKEK